MDSACSATKTYRLYCCPDARSRTRPRKLSASSIPTENLLSPPCRRLPRSPLRARTSRSESDGDTPYIARTCYTEPGTCSYRPLSKPIRTLRPRSTRVDTRAIYTCRGNWPSGIPRNHSQRHPNSGKTGSRRTGDTCSGTRLL